VGLITWEVPSHHLSRTVPARVLLLKNLDALFISLISRLPLVSFIGCTIP
jgi:hypothetical protein